MARPTRMRPTAGPAGNGAVSVIIPCHNYGHFLEDAMVSALRQTGVELELIVLDDASTDDSLSVALRLARQDARVQVFSHEENRGHVETYNELLALASGEYIVKLDADDLLAPGALARSVALLSRTPGMSFCYGRTLEFASEPPEARAQPVRSWIVWDGQDWVERVLRRGHGVIRQPEVMMRAAAVVRAGGYDVRLRWAEDHNLWLRLASVGSVGWIDGPPQGLYRVHGNSLQRSVRDIELTDLRARISAVDAYLRWLPSTPRAGRLSQTAYVSLLRNARELAGARMRRAPASALEVRAIAADLEARLDRRLNHGPTAWASTTGDLARDLAWRVRSRALQSRGV